VNPTAKPFVLRHAGFRNLWIGQIISQFGDVLYALVFLWMVLEVTGDEGAVGIVGAAQALPYVVLSAYAGTVVDRCDRRLLLILSDLVSAALVLGFVGVLLFDPKPSLWVICLVAFLLGSANVFAGPARSAAIPRLVPQTQLVEANALNSTTQNAMPLAGNVVSAVFLHTIFTVSAALAYVITFSFNAVSFLVSAVFMARLPKMVPKRESAPKSALHDAVEGVKFVVHHPVLGPAMLVSLAMNFFVAPFMPAYVVVAQEKFQGTPGLLAMLDTGFFSGMLIGSLLVFRVQIRRVGLAFSLWLSLASLTVMPMGYIGSPYGFWALNFLCGVMIPLASVPLNTLIQLETPDGLRGRVNSALAMVASMVLPVGMALSGLLIKRMGIEGIFLFMGAGLGISPLLALLFPGYRHAKLPSGSEAEQSEESLPTVG
jgi:DHA3 family macrolide efflux protein-like MFS transporter